MNYNNIKNFVLKLIPKSFLLRFEYSFRYFVYLNHLGSKYQCNICNKKLEDFITLEDNDQLCPRCGSIQRNRRLYQVLNSQFLKPNISVLDFSPSRCLHRLLKKANLNYLSSDLSGHFNADVSYDITAIDSKNNSFDLIIC